MSLLKKLWIIKKKNNSWCRYWSEKPTMTEYRPDKFLCWRLYWQPGSEMGFSPEKTNYAYIMGYFILLNILIAWEFHTLYFGHIISPFPKSPRSSFTSLPTQVPILSFSLRKKYRNKNILSLQKTQNYRVWYLLSVNLLKHFNMFVRYLSLYCVCRRVHAYVYVRCTC